MKPLMIFKIVNALIFFGLILFFGRKPFRQFFLDRSRRLRDTILRIARQKEIAESRLMEFRGKLDQIEAETGELITDFKRAGEIEKKNLIEKAEKYAERLRADTLRVGKQELGRAESMLKRTTMILALSMAEESIRRGMTSEDQTRLVRWGVEKLPETSHEE